MEPVFDLKLQKKLYIHEGMSTYNIYLYLPKHHNNRECYQWLDKVMLDPMGTSTTEKLKCTKWDLSNLNLINYGKLSGEAQLNFACTIMVHLWLPPPPPSSTPP